MRDPFAVLKSHHQIALVIPWVLLGLTRKILLVELKNELQNRLGYNLRRSSALMMSHLARELSDVDLKVTEVSALSVISENEGCSQSEVGVAMVTKRANMVPIIQQLMARGLVDRVKTDGRARALHLTDEGHVMVGLLKKKIADHELSFVGMLSKREHQELLRLLRKIRGL